MQIYQNRVDLKWRTEEHASMEEGAASRKELVFMSLAIIPWSISNHVVELVTDIVAWSQKCWGLNES